MKNNFFSKITKIGILENIKISRLVEIISKMADFSFVI